MSPEPEPLCLADPAGGRVSDLDRQRWLASERLMAAVDRARRGGYRPGSADMAALADAEARYMQAKAAAHALAACASRRPMTLGRFDPMPVAARPVPGRLSLS